MRDWFDERYEDALFDVRIRQGRCGNCGIFDGPDHRCPPTMPEPWSDADLKPQPEPQPVPAPQEVKPSWCAAARAGVCDRH